MTLDDRLPIWLRIVLACLLIAVLGILPYPRQLQIAFQQADQAEADQKPGQAARRLGEVLAWQPWRADVWEQTGQDWLEAGQLIDAIAAFREAQARGQLTPAGQQALGDAYLQAGDPEKALATWQELIDLGRGSVQVYERSYRLRRSQGELPQALDVLRAWMASDPRNTSIRYQQGLLLLVLQPDQTLPAELLETAQQDSSYTARVETLRKASGLAMGSDNRAYRRLIIGRALGNLDEWDLARLEFLGATEISPTYAEAWAFLGEAYQHLDLDGLPYLEKAAQLSPDSVVVQALYSVYYRRKDEPKRALEFLQKMILAEPEQPIWLVESGNTIASAGDLIAALPYFQKAVALEPGNPVYWQALALFSVESMMDIQNIGLPAARQALQLTPEDPAAMDLMGQAFYKLGDLASAERFLQRALVVNPTYAGAHLHLGQVYLQWERSDLAYNHLSAAKRLSGDGLVGVMAKRLLAQFFSGGG